jgi:hypothetical protein
MPKTAREKLHERLDWWRVMLDDRGITAAEFYRTPERLARLAVNSAAVEGITLNYERVRLHAQELLCQELEAVERDKIVAQLTQEAQDMGFYD